MDVYHGLKRNSYYSVYFEGDLSQERKHFLIRDSIELSDTVTAVIKQIRNEESSDLGLVLNKDNIGGGKVKNRHNTIIGGDRKKNILRSVKLFVIIILLKLF